MKLFAALKISGYFIAIMLFLGAGELFADRANAQSSKYLRQAPQQQRGVPDSQRAFYKERSQREIPSAQRGRPGHPPSEYGRPSSSYQPGRDGHKKKNRRPVDPLRESDLSEDTSSAPRGQALAGESAEALAVFALLNKERLAAGAPELTLDAKLNDLARIRAEELLVSYSHTRPDGTQMDAILDLNKVPWTRCAENIAHGYNNAASVMSAWMESKGHRENILNKELTHVGIGVCRDGKGHLYWTQLFVGTR